MKSLYSAIAISFAALTALAQKRDIPVYKDESKPIEERVEVDQLYISDSVCSVMRPAKELKGFVKVFLQPGETKCVTFTIDKNDLSYFDENSHKWVAEPGKFVATVASASDKPQSSVEFTLE